MKAIPSFPLSRRLLLRTRTSVLKRIGAAGLTVGLLGPLALWSCEATRGADGSIHLTFAPDMTLTVLGLEDTRRQVAALLRKCLSGTWARPCTQEEIEKLQNTLDKTIELKEKAVNKGPSTPGGGRGIS